MGKGKTGEEANCGPALDGLMAERQKGERNPTGRKRKGEKEESKISFKPRGKKKQQG